MMRRPLRRTPSTLLTNSADFTYMDGNGLPSPGDPRLNDTAVLTVLQPVMDALTKTDRLGKNSGDPVNVASDIMNFRCKVVTPRDWLALTVFC